MKRLTALVLFVTVLLTMCATGCKPDNCIADTEYYTLYKENGKYYLEFKTVLPDRDPSLLETSFVTYDKVSSIGEMKQKILAGDFSAEGMKALRLGSPNTMEVCNLENLYEVQLPTGQAVRHITWKGMVYHFELEQTGYVECITREAYENRLDLLYTNAIKKDIPVEYEETGRDGKTVLKRYQHGATLIRHDLSSEEKELYAVEIFDSAGFRLEYVDTCPATELIPDRIRFFGKMNGAYFYGYLSDLPSRPSVEWLSSFGLTPYVEEGTA